MNKGVKIALIVAACAVGLGIILCGVFFAVGGVAAFKSFYSGGSSIQNGSAEQKSYDIAADKLSSISFELASADIRVGLSDDEKIHIDYLDGDGSRYDISEKSGALRFVQKNSGIGSIFNAQYSGITLLVPEKYQGSLKIETASGEIFIESTGITEEISLHSASGDIRLSAVACGGNLSIGTASGEIYLSASAVGGSLFAESVSGDISAEAVAAGGDLSFTTTSGEIDISEAEALSFELSSTSGDIDAAFSETPDDYIFNVYSVSGDVDYPGEYFRGSIPVSAKTVSGDIELIFK